MCAPLPTQSAPCIHFANMVCAGCAVFSSCACRLPRPCPQRLGFCRYQPVRRRPRKVCQTSRCVSGAAAARKRRSSANNVFGVNARVAPMRGPVPDMPCHLARSAGPAAQKRLGRNAMSACIVNAAVAPTRELAPAMPASCRCSDGAAPYLILCAKPFIREFCTHEKTLHALTT